MATNLLHLRFLGLLSIFLWSASYANAQEVIHCWDFNGTSLFTSPIPTDHRVTGEGSINHTFTSIQNFTGDTTNACEGVTAGSAFSPEGISQYGESFTMTFPTIGFRDIILTFAVQGNGTGFNTAVVEYSTNAGASWNNAPSSFGTPSSFALREIDFSSIEAVNDISGFQIKITLSVATSVTGHNRFDNIQLKGNSIFEGLQIKTLNTVEVINFDEAKPGVLPSPYGGEGFSPSPDVGQFNSNAIATSGMSDGDFNFGDSNATGDFARGLQSVGVTTAGFYAYEVQPDNRAFGFKPGGSDFTPGSFTLRVQNQTGVSINNFDLAYGVWILNSQDRSSSLKAAFSVDNITFTPIPDFDFTSPEAQDMSPVWVNTAKEKLGIDLEQLIPHGAYLYIRILSDDVLGSGSRDEIAIDDFKISLDHAVDTFVIDFDDDTKWTDGFGGITSNQIDHTYEDQQWRFTGGPALRNTTSPQDGFSLAFGNYSWRLANEVDMVWTATYLGSDPIASFGFDLRRWSENPEVDYSIHYSFDGGVSFVDTGVDINNAFLSNSSDWSSFEFDLPSIQHPAAGDFVVHIKRNGGDRLSIDNFNFKIPLENVDSNITAPNAQIGAGDLVVGEAIGTINSVPVFAFQIEDLGSGDGLSTLTNSMRFVAGPQNTADFSEILDQVVIRVNGSRIFNTSTTINLLQNEINIEFDYSQGNVSSLLPVMDNTSIDIEVSLSLKTQGLESGSIVQLAIEDDSLGFGVEQTSSIFSRLITPIIGNEFDVKVEATQLRFIEEPQYAKVNTPMPFGVSVAATDADGNIKRSFSADIEVTSTGALQNSPLVVSPLNGIANFEVVHTAIGDQLKLNAKDLSSVLMDISSLNFNIYNPLELFISEVTDPQDDIAGRYVELFNHGVETIDFDTKDVFLVIEFNGGSSYRTVKLTGLLEAKSYFLIGRSDFSTVYGFSADKEQSALAAVASGNGDDTYFLSFGGGTTSERIRHFFDVYGDIGLQANNATPWFYKDQIAYRLTPPSVEESKIWNSEEWNISNATISLATPGYGNQDHIYLDNTEAWNSIGLGNPFTTSLTDEKNIDIRAGEVTFDQALTVNDLVVRAGAQLIIEDVLTVKGDIVNEGKVIFKSDVNRTAVLGEASGRSRVVGEFEIERHIPKSNRAYRYLSSSLTTSSSIRDNWQEGVNRLMIGDEHIQNPNPGYGTHISGSTTGEHGFDATGTGNPSMFEWNVINQEWNSISNTETKTLSSGEAYALFIRGDRSTTLMSNTAVGPATTLRTTGSLVVGDKLLSNMATEIGEFTLVGNPYQAKVNMSELLNMSTSGLSSEYVYIYDPTLGTRGGYATVTLSDGSAIPQDSGADGYLEAQQAFFVETIETTITPELLFKESFKSMTAVNDTTFRITEEQTWLSINLYFSDIEAKAVDAVKVKFSDGGNNEKDKLDATKIWNYGEAFAIDRSPYYTSIENRAMPTSQDSIPLYFGNYTRQAYRLEIKPVELTSVKAYLYDRYLKTHTELPSDVITSFSFNLDHAVPESIATDRFVIKFEEVSLGTEGIEFDSSISVYPNPLNGTSFKISTTYAFEGEDLNLKVFDVQGRRVLVQTLNNSSRMEVKLETPLFSGVYILKISDGLNSLSTKLIID
jgi:hypothetical protein